MDFNDVDYCLKVINSTKKVILDPRIELYHYESASRGKNLTISQYLKVQKNKKYFNKKWKKYIPDPFFDRVNYVLNNSEDFTNNC